MLVTLKGQSTQVEIGVTTPIGIASYPDNTDNPVQEHKIHFFVFHTPTGDDQGLWAEISRTTYNALAAAGNPTMNVDTTVLKQTINAIGFGYAAANKQYFRFAFDRNQQYRTPSDDYFIDYVVADDDNYWTIAGAVEGEMYYRLDDEDGPLGVWLARPGYTSPGTVVGQWP